MGLTDREHSADAHSAQSISGLTGLRALACAAVFGVHWQQLTGIEGTWGPFDLKILLLNGNTGVCLFFLLSGFLLSLPTWQRNATGAPAAGRWRRETLLRYTLDRAARILPAYYLCLTVLIIAGQEWQSWNGARSITLHYLFLHNITGSTLYDISPPFWTLAVQAQFYVVLPILLWALFRPPHRTRALAIAALACLGAYAIHFALAEFIAPALPSVLCSLYSGQVAEHSLLAHLPHFLLGVLAAGLHVRLSTTSLGSIADHPRCWDAVFWGSLAVVFCILVNPWLDRLLCWSHGRYNWPYVPALLAAIIIAAPRCRSACTVLEFSPIRGLGRISYGVYVYHLPCMKFVAGNADHLGQFFARDPLGLALTSIVATVGVATTSWYVIERPFLRWIKHRRRVSPADGNDASHATATLSRPELGAQLVRTLFWLAVSIAVVAALIQALLLAPRIPYNVRELFQRDLRPLRILVFAAIPIWVGFALRGLVRESDGGRG